MRTYASKDAPNYASLTAAGCEQDGEPVFLIRAQDQYAAQVVRFWARIASFMNPKVYDEVLPIAAAMDKWLPKKQPD